MPGLNNHQCAWFTITSVWQLITFFCSEFPSSSCFRSTAMCLGFENRTAAPPPAPDQLPAPRNRPVGSSPAHRCPSTEESWPNEKISTALYHMHRRDPITTDVPRGRAAESHISYQITPDFSLTDCAPILGLSFSSQEKVFFEPLMWRCPNISDPGNECKSETATPKIWSIPTAPSVGSNWKHSLPAGCFMPLIKARAPWVARLTFATTFTTANWNMTEGHRPACRVSMRSSAPVNLWLGVC